MNPIEGMKTGFAHAMRSSHGLFFSPGLFLVGVVAGLGERISCS